MGLATIIHAGKAITASVRRRYLAKRERLKAKRNMEELVDQSLDWRNKNYQAQIDPVWKNTMLARANEQVEFALLRIEDARNELIEAQKELNRAELERRNLEDSKRIIQAC